MEQAVLWALAATAFAALCAFVAWQWRALRAAGELAARLERQLAHAAGFALMGQLGASSVQEIALALRGVSARAAAAQSLLDADEVPRAQVQDTLAELRSEAVRAGDMAQRLLGLLARGDTQRQPVDLHQLLAESVRLLEAEARRGGAELILHSCAQRGAVVADRGQLQLVLLQLLTNAIEAMGQTPAALRRVLVTTHDADGRVEVQVSDRGHGFGERRADTLFTPYYTTKEGRMGLGLSVARSIVRAHDGSIEARRRAGGGAVFTLTLPCLAAAPAPVRTTPAARALAGDWMVQP